MHNLIIISDLHLRDGSVADTFTNERACIDLLLAYKNDIIVLNGDIFDISYTQSLPIIENTYPRLCDVIARYVTFIARGNHEAFLRTACNQYLYSQIQVDGIRIKHGHDYDALNHGSLAWAGDFVTWATGKIDRYIYRDFTEDIGGVVFRMLRQGKFGDLERYRRFALDTISRDGTIDSLVLGHTHIKEVRPELRYWNTGCWVRGHTDVLIIPVSSNPVVRLWE